MIENIDKSALVAQRTEAERLTNLLKGFTDEERKGDPWISILGGYFAGRKEMADLLINKSKTDVVVYIHNAIIEARSDGKLADGTEELWGIIQEKFKSSQFFPVFDYLIKKWRKDRDIAEAKFIGAWDLVAEFRVLDATYSFLSPENNGVKGVHITEIRNRAVHAHAKYKY